MKIFIANYATDSDLEAENHMSSLGTGLEAMASPQFYSMSLTEDGDWLDELKAKAYEDAMADDNEVTETRWVICDWIIPEEGRPNKTLLLQHVDGYIFAQIVIQQIEVN